MKMRLLTLALTTAVFSAPVAHAAGTGWYLGMGVGQSKAKDMDDISGYDDDLEQIPSLTASVSRDDKDTGWKVYAGYRINENFAVEGGYVHLGKFGYSASFTGTIDVEGGAFPFSGSASLKAKAQALTLSALGIVPVSQNFELFGKLGVAYWDVKTTGTVFATFGGASATWSETVSKKGTSLNFGLGAMYNITKNLTVRAEWERFNDVGEEETTGKSDIDLLSLGMMFSF